MVISITTVLYIIILSILISLGILFWVHLWYKLELHQWYDTYRKKWMPKRCLFCGAFWMGFITCLWMYWRGTDPIVFGCIPCIPVIVVYLFKR